MTRADEVARLLKLHPAGLTADELATKVGVARQNMLGILRGMSAKGQVIVTEGTFQLPRSPSEQSPRADLRKELLALLKLYPHGASTRALAAEVDLPAGVVNSSLNILRRRGQVEVQHIKPKYQAAYAVWRLPEWEP